METNEDIYEICQNLDSDSLIEIMKENDRYYDVCKGILEERNKGKDIRGVLVGGKLGLLIPGKGGNPRFGLSCRSLSLEELREIAISIGIVSDDLEDLSQRGLCDLIKENLRDNGKIISEIELPSKRSTLGYNDCSSSYDFVTSEDWDQKSPDIKIKFITDTGSMVNCYDAEALKTWLNDPDNTFALWVEKPGGVMDSVGHGGRPNLFKTYVKFYTGEFVVNDDTIEKLRSGSLRGKTLIAKQTGSNVRIGNIEGSFGIGKLHGQIPGYRTYRITSK